MAICDIAGLKVDIRNMTGRTGKQAQPYLAENQDEKNVDIVIDVSPERVEAAKKEHPELNSDAASLIMHSGGRHRICFFGGQRNRQINTHIAVAETLRRPRAYGK